jgi:hypothetical protein
MYVIFAFNRQEDQVYYVSQYFSNLLKVNRWSQWPRVLRSRSATTGCLSVVSVVCCEVEVSATS